MKKILAFAVSCMFFAGSAFAATADKAPDKSTADTVELTTLTKSLSEADYPVVLDRGNIQGTGVFVGDYALMPNFILIERLSFLDSTYAMGSVMTDYGRFGLAMKPAPFDELMDIDVDITHDFYIYSGHYAGKIFGMGMGIQLDYGTYRKNYECKDPANFYASSASPVKSDESLQYMGVKLGTTIDVGLPLDIAFGAALANEIDDEVYYYVYSSYWDYDYRMDNNKYIYNLDARADFGGGLSATAGLKWIKGGEKEYYAYQWSEEYYNYENGRLAFDAYVGKAGKATEWLNVKTSLGLNIAGDASAKHTYWYHDDEDEYIVYDSGSFYEDSVFSMPLNVAVEAKINENWKVNAGIKLTALLARNEKTIFNRDTSGWTWRPADEDATSYLEINPGVEYTLGISGRIGPVILDLFVNPDILTDGPYMLTGNSIGDLNSGVAIHYEW
ncbi:MAG: hypothetical protein LLG37_06875 [Spirochaetia bacterium]|nr:hypothetical protein [Spirochaetia bacterium]